jgi:hypothetical protein
MSLARRFSERAAAAALSCLSTGMALGGLALAGFGATLRQTGFELAELPIITTGLMAVGAVLAVTGAIAVVWARGIGYSGGSTATRHGGWPLLVLAAMALPLALLRHLAPLVSYWSDIARLADRYDVWQSANGPSALLFVPAAGVLLVPGIAALAAMAVLATCGAVTLLVFARSHAALKLGAIGALLVGGLSGATWLGVAATERLAPGVDTLIRTTMDLERQEQARALALLGRHRTVGVQSAWALSWAWAGVVALALGARAVVKRRPDGAPTANPLDGVALDGLDDLTRERALLDAADELHRSTPPARRF